jgi:hypothetical protein
LGVGEGGIISISPYLAYGVKLNDEGLLILFNGFLEYGFRFLGELFLTLEDFDVFRLIGFDIVP